MSTPTNTTEPMEKNTSKPIIMMHCYGEAIQVQRTALGFLSLQSNIPDETPKYKAIIATDKPKYIKSYFSNWVELLHLDQQKTKEGLNEEAFVQRLKGSLIRDVMQQNQQAVLYFDNDIYHSGASLSALQDIVADKVVLGKKEILPIQIQNDLQNFNNKLSHVFDTGVIGIPISQLNKLEQVFTTFNDLPKSIAASWRERIAFTLVFDNATEFLEDIHHYKTAQKESEKQIERFFNHHYYREIGELYKLVEMWKPDLWSKNMNDLPKELI